MAKLRWPGLLLKEVVLNGVCPSLSLERFVSRGSMLGLETVDKFKKAAGQNTTIKSLNGRVQGGCIEPTQ